MKITRWEGCYDASWKGAITNASFGHPAKMSRGLLERIIKHGLSASARVSFGDFTRRGFQRATNAASTTRKF